MHVIVLGGFHKRSRSSNRTCTAQSASDKTISHVSASKYFTRQRQLFCSLLITTSNALRQQSCERNSVFVEVQGMAVGPKERRAQHPPFDQQTFSEHDCAVGIVQVCVQLNHKLLAFRAENFEIPALRVYLSDIVLGRQAVRKPL